MSWQDRDYAREGDGFRRLGGPGGDLGGLRPVIDNPMTWSVPLGTVAGITVRVHLLLLVFIIYMLLASAITNLAFGPTALMLACLFVIILLHEFGHCLACRAVNGEASEILMWPLGGLAYCRPPDHWTAHFVTVAGGPLVNVAIMAVITPLLGFLTRQWWGVAIPNPFGLDASPVAYSWWLMALYMANWLSLVLLLFNMLPIFPFDGGRIVQALLWSRLGYSRAMRAAVWTGYVGAVALVLFGLSMNRTSLVIIALFGGYTCFVASRQVAFTDEFMGFDSQGEPGTRRASSKRRAQRQADRQARRQREEESRVDAILDKIAQHGMQSLSGAEKRFLKRTSQRKKHSG